LLARLIIFVSSDAAHIASNKASMKEQKQAGKNWDPLISPVHTPHTHICPLTGRNWVSQKTAQLQLFLAYFTHLP